MELLKIISLILFCIILGYIIIRVFAYGIAKSVIEAIQQNIHNRKENKNGIKKERSNAEEITEKDRAEREDKGR